MKGASRSPQQLNDNFCSRSSTKYVATALAVLQLVALVAWVLQEPTLEFEPAVLRESGAASSRHDENSSPGPGNKSRNQVASALRGLVNETSAELDSVPPQPEPTDDEPFPREPAPWGFGNDPSYGVCLNRRCTRRDTGVLASLHLPADFAPCEGSAVAKYGGGVADSGTCPPEARGRCMHILDTLKPPGPQKFESNRFRNSGLFHFVDNMCDADIVFSGGFVNTTEAVIEQFLPKRQRIINFQRWNTKDGGINSKDALAASLNTLPSRTYAVEEETALWRTEAGTTMDFDPTAWNPMPRTYVLSQKGDRAQFLVDSVAAGDASVLAEERCGDGAGEVERGDAMLPMPYIFKNGRNYGSAGNVLIWNLQLLRDVRCDIITVEKLMTGAKGARAQDLRVLKTKMGPFTAWSAQPFIDTLLMPVTLSNGQEEWRVSYIRSFVMIASSVSPTLLHHDGYVRVGAYDGRNRDIRIAETVLPNSHVRSGQQESSEDIASSPIADMQPVLEAYFPDHPDPWARLHCLMDRAAVLAFAATKDDGTFETNGFRDRHWWFGLDFMIDKNGKVYLIELNRTPAFLKRVPHTSSAAREWLRDMAYSMAAVEDLRRAGAERTWPLPGVKYSRPILIDDSTQAPALEWCRREGGEVPLGPARLDIVPPLSSPTNDVSVA